MLPTCGCWCHSLGRGAYRAWWVLCRCPCACRHTRDSDTTGKDSKTIGFYLVFFSQSSAASKADFLWCGVRRWNGLRTTLPLSEVTSYVTMATFMRNKIHAKMPRQESTIAHSSSFKLFKVVNVRRLLW